MADSDPVSILEKYRQIAARDWLPHAGNSYNPPPAGRPSSSHFRPSTRNGPMQGSQQVIDALNEGLTIELTAINQYFIQSRMCSNWGFHKLAKHHYDESIEEMQHAQLLIDRIIFLEGVPEIARYDVIRAGTNVKEQLQFDLEVEAKASKVYNDASRICFDNKDAASREIVERIIRESEESLDWLEAQLELIDTIGLELYLQSQMGEEEGG